MAEVMESTASPQSPIPRRTPRRKTHAPEPFHGDYTPRRVSARGKRKKSNSVKHEHIWQVRRILDERFHNGRREFLVDWEDDAHGGSFEPSWVSWTDYVGLHKALI